MKYLQKNFKIKKTLLYTFILLFIFTFLYGYSTLSFNNTDKNSSILKYTLILCFVMGILAVFFKMIKNKIVFMCVILVVVASLYYLLLPIGNGPDEVNHFFRAFEISCGNLVSKHVGENQLGGNILPSALIDYANKNAEIDWNQVTEITFPTMSLYAPIAYFPQAIAIKIARIITNNVYTIFMAGRFGAMIVNILLSCWALYKMPFGKEILFLIMLFPMNIQQMVVMSSDGWTMGIISLFLAYILNLIYNEKKQKIIKWDYIILFILGLCISLSKIVYIVICLAIFMLPYEKFKNKKQAMICKVGLIVSTLISNLLWLSVSYSYMTEFNPGVNSTEQIKYVLHNIPEFYLISIRTIFTNGAFWIQSMIGSSLGKLDIPTNWSVWLIYLILLVCVICFYRMEVIVELKNNIICFIIFFGVSALIFCSLYVQWTVYKNPIIDGIQGRYFIPILIFLIIPLISFFGAKSKTQEFGKNIRETKMNFFVAFIPLTLNFIALIDILNFISQNV